MVGRLVEQEVACLLGERTGDEHPLALTARELICRAMREVGDAGALHRRGRRQFVGVAIATPPGQPRRAPEQHRVPLSAERARSSCETTAIAARCPRRERSICSPSTTTRPPSRRIALRIARSIVDFDPLPARSVRAFRPSGQQGYRTIDGDRVPVPHGEAVGGDHPASAPVPSSTARRPRSALRGPATDRRSGTPTIRPSRTAVRSEAPGSVSRVGRAFSKLSP